MTDFSRRTVVFGASVLPLATLVARTAAYAAPAGPLTEPLKSVLEAPQWLNTPPLRPEDVRGKVVLLNVWTYSCINSLRTLPYLRAWAAKYKDDGLVVIGVHSPEFAFERDLDNVRTALAFLGVGWPVAIDNGYRIWRTLDNDAWPAFYFIGVDGRVRYHLDGEGNYDLSEGRIQKLLSDGGRRPRPSGAVTAHSDGIEAAPDFEDERSPETYVGYAHSENFAVSWRSRTKRLADIISACRR